MTASELETELRAFFAGGDFVAGLAQRGIGLTVLLHGPGDVWAAGSTVEPMRRFEALRAWALKEEPGRNQLLDD